MTAPEPATLGDEPTRPFLEALADADPDWLSRFAELWVTTTFHERLVETGGGHQGAFLICGSCAAMVSHTSADDHDRWHLQLSAGIVYFAAALVRHTDDNLAHQDDAT